MADGDRAAVHVDLGRIPAEALVDRAGLCGEGFIGFDEIEVLHGPAGLLERLAGCRNGARAHDRGIDTGVRPRDDARERLDAALVGFLERHEHHRRRAVVDAGGVRRGNRAFLVEGRTQLRDGLERDAVLDVLVIGNDHVALARLDRHRNDLVLEAARLPRRLGLVLRSNRELVLLVSADLPLARVVLGGRAHVIAVEGIPQAVLDHRVDHLGVAHLHTVAQVHDVRRLAHALLAAGDDDRRRAFLDLLGAERDRAQARAAELVHAPGGRVDRDAGRNGRLAGRVLAGAGREDLAHDDFGHVAGRDAGTIERAFDRRLAEFMRRQACQRTVE